MLINKKITEGDNDHTANEPDGDIMNNDVFQPLPTPNVNDSDDTSLIEDNNGENSTVQLFVTQFNDHWQLTFNDNWFEFNHRWQYHRQYPAQWLPRRILHSTRGYCGSPGTVGTADGYCRVLWVLLDGVNRCTLASLG